MKLCGIELKQCLEENVWKWKSLSSVQLFATPWPGACQTPLSMEFSRQNTGVGNCSFSKGSSKTWDRPQVFCIAGGFFTDSATREAQNPLEETEYL